MILLENAVKKMLNQAGSVRIRLVEQIKNLAL